jgi:hypothetical protein
MLRVQALIRDLCFLLLRLCFLQVLVIVVQTSSMAVVRRVARLDVIGFAIGIVGCYSDFEMNFGCACRLFDLLLWSKGLLSRIYLNQFVIESLGWRWESSKPHVSLG